MKYVFTFRWKYETQKRKDWICYCRTGNHTYKLKVLLFLNLTENNLWLFARLSLIKRSFISCVRFNFKAFYTYWMMMKIHLHHFHHKLDQVQLKKIIVKSVRRAQNWSTYHRQTSISYIYVYVYTYIFIKYQFERKSERKEQKLPYWLQLLWASMMICITHLYI